MDAPTIALVGCRPELDRNKLFVNGYVQNVQFFYHMLNTHMKEYTLLLINNESDLYCNHSIDLFIQFSPLSKEQSEKIKVLHPNHKSVFVKYGHEYYNDLSRLLPDGQNAVHHSPCAYNVDEVWISPHFLSTKHYYEALYNAQTKIAPFIWSPTNLRMTPFTKDDFTDCEKNIFIVEPNINTMKTSLIPILIVNELYKSDPTSFDKVYIVSNNMYNENTYFTRWLLPKLEVLHAHHNKTYFCKKASFPDIFKEPGILLSHQENCDLNYMYLEALHVRIPWVHNSPHFHQKECGYYYQDKNIPEGVESLKKALSEFCPVSNDDIIQQYSYDNPEVIDEYKDMINRLLA